MRPDQTAVVIKRTVEGLTTRDIGQEIGLSRTAVNNVQHRPDVKAKIERAADHIINRGLQPAVKTLCRLAAMGNVKDADKDSLKLSLDASKHITGMAGLSGAAPSTIINAMIQINQAPEQSKELDSIAAFLSSQWQQSDNHKIIEHDNQIIRECEEKAGTRTDTTTTGIQTPHTANLDIISPLPDPPTPNAS